MTRLLISLVLLLITNVAIFLSNYQKIQNLHNKLTINIVYGVALAFTIIYFVIFGLMSKGMISKSSEMINLEILLYIGIFINVVSIALILTQLLKK
jgi:hypothetical protein